MREYEIKSLENGKVLETIAADGFSIGEGGIVTFYQSDVIMRVNVKDHYPMTTNKTIAVTQVSSSTLIIEKIAPQPALVVPIDHHRV